MHWKGKNQGASSQVTHHLFWKGAFVLGAWIYGTKRKSVLTRRQNHKCIEVSAAISLLSNLYGQISIQALPALVIEACVGSLAVEWLEARNIPWVKNRGASKDTVACVAFFLSIQAKSYTARSAGLDPDAISAIGIPDIHGAHDFNLSDEDQKKYLELYHFWCCCSLMLLLFVSTLPILLSAITAMWCAEKFTILPTSCPLDNVYTGILLRPLPRLSEPRFVHRGWFHANPSSCFVDSNSCR